MQVGHCGETADLNGFGDHCFDIWPPSIFDNCLDKAAGAQAFHASKSSKPAVFNTTEVLSRLEGGTLPSRIWATYFHIADGRQKSWAALLL